MAVTILVIDDEKQMCRALEKAMIREGYKVITEQNAHRRE